MKQKNRLVLLITNQWFVSSHSSDFPFIEVNLRWIQMRESYGNSMIVSAFFADMQLNNFTWLAQFSLKQYLQPLFCSTSTTYKAVPAW